MIMFDYTQTSPRNPTRQTRISSLDALGRGAAPALDAVLNSGPLRHAQGKQAKIEPRIVR
jgi:hypothetical protein